MRFDDAFSPIERLWFVLTMTQLLKIFSPFATQKKQTYVLVPEGQTSQAPQNEAFRILARSLRSQRVVSARLLHQQTQRRLKICGICFLNGEDCESV